MVTGTTRHACLYLLFTPELCANEPSATLEKALANGVDRVQWRVANPAARRGELDRYLAICAEHGVDLIVNDDVELARRPGVAGAHVGQDDLPVTEARRRLGPDRLLGASTHDIEQIRAAERDGADHLGFGPCFPTETKGYREGLGSRALAAALAATELPVFAIGGITAANVGELVAVGCRRVAVSGAVLRAGDPARAAGELRAVLV